MNRINLKNQASEILGEDLNWEYDRENADSIVAEMDETAAMEIEKLLVAAGLFCGYVENAETRYLWVRA